MLFETTDVCFSFFNNPEIEALNLETPGQTRRVGNPTDIAASH